MLKKHVFSLSKSQGTAWIKACILVLILLLGLLLRIGATRFDRPIPDYSDSSTYDYAARNLLKYGVLTNDRDGAMYRGEVDIKPASNVMPGLPFFLAALYMMGYSGGGGEGVYWIQIILSVITLLLIYILLRQCKVSFLISACTLVFAAVYPGFCYNLDLILTETLFTTLLVGSVVCIVSMLQQTSRSLLWLCMGTVLLMCAAMVRAQALPLLLVLCFMILVYLKRDWKIRITYIGAIFGIMLLFLTPLWIRNWIQFHQFWILTAAGDGPKIWGAQPYFLDMASTGQYSLQELAQKNIASGPATYWKWRIFGFFQYMWFDFWDENLVHPFRGLAPFRLIHQFLIVPALAAIPWLVRKGKKEILLVASMPLLFTLMAMPYHGLPRYVFPAIPFVFVIVGVLAEKLYCRVTKHNSNADEEENDLAGISRVVDTLFRFGYFGVACLFSIVLLFSVYIFSWNISGEMSNYRLGRAYGISGEEADKLSICNQTELSTDKETWWVDNVSQGEDGMLHGMWDATPILSVRVPETVISINSSIITKIELDIPSNYMFDLCTIYWAGDKTAEFSENCVYSFPRNVFSSKQTVYIDENVTSLMVVPARTRGASFSVNEISITKYEIPVDAHRSN